MQLIKKCQCGSEVQVTVKIKHPWNTELWHIICYNCGYVGDNYPTMEEAIKKWNNEAHQPGRREP